MRHHNKNRKFGRVRKERTALMRSLARSLILRGTMVTTEAKAKELRPYVEPLITKSRSNTLAVRRQLISKLGGAASAVSKLLLELGPKYKERTGGYTRITKLGIKGDDARSLARIEFVE